MYKLSYKLRKIGPLLGLLSMLLLGSCRDDDLIIGSEEGNGFKIKEPSLVFDLNLTPFDNEGEGGGGSIAEAFLDHGENWENYVDPAKLRVIFCDNKGYFLFEVDRNNISIISKDKSWTAGSLAYRVVISQKELYPDWGRDPGQNDAIKKAIEKDGFKVAVLANWPNFVEGRRTLDPYTGDEMLGNESEPTLLKFQWVPSDQPNKPDNSHISWLSHCIFDNVYGVTAYDDDNTPIEPYRHLTYHQPSEPGGQPNLGDQKGQMGVFKSWVSYIYHTQKDAATAIREGEEGARSGVRFTYDCTGLDYWRKTKEIPEINSEDFTYTDYSYERTVDAQNQYTLDNIWRLWNFSAGQACRYHSECKPSVQAYWHLRNKHVLVRELKKSSNWQNGFTIKNHAGETLIESTNANARFVEYEDGNTESGYLTLPSVMSKSDFDKINKNKPTNEKTLVSNFKKGAIHFKAYGEGTLRIRAKRAGNDESAGKIAVITLQEGSSEGGEVVEYITERTDDGIYSEKTADPYFQPLDRGKTFTWREEYGEGGEYILDPSSRPYVDVYIGAIDDEVDIYEIEYMRARHIYDSARNAIMPSADDPIPMYGIQNFDPIGDGYLQNNQTFNLSDESQNIYLDEAKRRQYNYKDIFLLRSVAKVEIKFKKSVFANNPPTHVMMRVMNRTGRCEPKDVVNPTEWIWYGDGNPNKYVILYEKWKDDHMVKVDDGARPWTFPGIEGEFENIREYYKRAPLHDSGTSSIKDYRKRTAWFYGIWGEEGDPRYYWANSWKWNGFDENPEPQSDLPYPRIFNTRIDRSDYCRFHCVPEEEGYIRYIMYVPEKNISDADSKGKLSASPKVQHIEVRFKNMNTTLNFDDNSHYRIYFTEYTDINGNNVNGEDLGQYNRDGLPASKDTFDAAERDDNNKLLNKLQPIVRNCHYIFTVNSINDKQIGVQFTVCGKASRESYGNGMVIN